MTSVKWRRRRKVGYWSDLYGLSVRAEVMLVVRGELGLVVKMTWRKAEVVLLEMGGSKSNAMEIYLFWPLR